MKERRKPLEKFIQRIRRVKINGVPITVLHELRGTLPSNDQNIYRAQEGDIWENVARHGATSLVVSDVLGRALKLSKEDRGYVNFVSWIEDAGKKTERKWQDAIKIGEGDFYKDEQPVTPAERQQKMLDAVGLMEEVENTVFGFSPRVHSRIHGLMRMNVPPPNGHGNDLAAKVRWFTDAIVHNDEILTIQERFNRLETDPKNGKKNIAFSDSFRSRYGGLSLYAMQRSLGEKYEKEFSDALGFTDKDTFYNFIRKSAQRRMKSRFLLKRRFALPS